MTTERRTNARGKNTSKVTFTDAASDTPSEGTLHDIGRGGMFIVTASKLPVGKRIDFEVHVTPGSVIQGMGRVIWVREEAGGDRPAGLGVKFIDVDNDALIAIDRLVGLKTNVRERTVLGMMAPVVVPPKAEPPKAEPPKAEPPRAEPPRPVIKGSRERTMLGVAPPPDVREKDLQSPLSRKSQSPSPWSRSRKSPSRHRSRRSHRSRRFRASFPNVSPAEATGGSSCSSCSWWAVSPRTSIATASCP
jgi:Tfp pilus assembly protein PilZ